MIQKLHSLHESHKSKKSQHETLSNTKNAEKTEQKVIENKTFTQFRQQLTFIESKIKILRSKRYSSKQNDWNNLKADINSILGEHLKLGKMRKVFERKFEEEIRLLNDFYTRRYHQSMFRFCFFCCPAGILRQLKYYKFIDDTFQVTISDVHKTYRNIYFYVNLLYIRLFMMLVAVADRLKEQFNKKMIEAMGVESKQAKIVQKRKKQVGELEDINDVFVMQEENFKDATKKDQIISSYIVQSDNPAQIKGKTEPRQPLDLSMMKKNYYDELKVLEQQIETIILNDWKDIINCQEWSSQSYYGFIQIDGGQPIETFLEFKDCKLKTNYLFGEISSTSFDLRTYLVTRSKTISKGYKYVLNPLHQDSVSFQLTFWLSEAERTDKNHESIEKFLLLALRIGIKQKIYRTCNTEYKEPTQNWMIRNYVHMTIKDHSHHNQDSVKNEPQSSSKSSYRSVSEASENKMTPEMFWWVNLGQELIRAIVQVADQKRQKQKQTFATMKKASSEKKKTKMPNQYDYNPETNDRLVKQMSKRNYYSTKEFNQI